MIGQLSEGAGGFTLAELLVAMALMLVVVAGVSALSIATLTSVESQSEAMDMQQRARVAADALSRDLLVAGAGVDRGPLTGALAGSVASVWPRRVGRVRADPTHLVRADALTLVYVPASIAQAALLMPLDPSAGELRVTQPPNCPVSLLWCGFSPGMTIGAVDPVGRLGLFAVEEVNATSARVRSLISTSGAFAAGTTVAEMVIRGYYHDAAARQLRYSDGDSTDQPVVDHIAGLVFSYFGDPNPPSEPRPPLGTANCLYDAEGMLLPRPVLPAVDHGLAELSLVTLSDGPWCGAGGTTFDADLLRVRRVRVALRVSAAPQARRRLPDYRLVFDIAPRNLTKERRW